MISVYQYNLSGEYVGKTVAYGGLLPANTTAVEPVFESGFLPVWNGNAWENEEDNRRTPYWLDGDTYQTPARYMTTLGPLPDGVLLDQPAKPAPTTDELAAKVRIERDKRITACDWVITRHRDEVDENNGTTLSADDYVAWLAYRKALRDLPLQDGFPWDGGGADDEDCPWPVGPDGELCCHA